MTRPRRVELGFKLEVLPAEQDVRRVDITVHEPVSMGVVHTADATCRHQLRGLPRFEPPPCHLSR